MAYWRGGFHPETGLLNRDDTAEPEPEPPEADRRQTAAPEARTARQREGALGGGRVLVAGLAALAIPVSR